MHEDERLRRQQTLSIVIGAISVAVVVFTAVRLILGDAGTASWWTLAGSSLTAIAMISTWFTLRSARRKSAEARAGRTSPPSVG